MNIPTDMNSAYSSISTTSMSQPPPPRPEGGKGGPPSHASAIETLGSTLSDDARDSLLTSVKEMQESGASFEEIKSFVDTELEANGVEVPAGGRQTGQLVDIVS